MHPLPLIARWFTVATAALLLAACAQTPPASPSATAASRTPPLAMLWVGNSFFYYNNSMHGHVSQLLARQRRGQSAAARADLGHHQRLGPQLARPRGALQARGAWARYSFNAKNEVVFNVGERDRPSCSMPC